MVDVADALEGPREPHAEHFAFAAELQRAGRSVGGAAFDVGVGAEEVEHQARVVERDTVTGADDGHRAEFVRRQLKLQRELVVQVPQRCMLVTDAGAQPAGALVAGVVQRQRPTACRKLADRDAGLDLTRVGTRLQGQRELPRRVFVGELDLPVDAPDLRRLAFAQLRHGTANVVIAELLVARDVDLRDATLEHHDGGAAGRAGLRWHVGHHRAVAGIAVQGLHGHRCLLQLRQGSFALERRQRGVKRFGRQQRVAANAELLDRNAGFLRLGPRLRLALRLRLRHEADRSDGADRPADSADTQKKPAGQLDCALGFCHGRRSGTVVCCCLQASGKKAHLSPRACAAPPEPYARSVRDSAQKLTHSNLCYTASGGQRTCIVLAMRTTHKLPLWP